MSAYSLYPVPSREPASHSPASLLGKTLGHRHKLSSGVSDTVGHDGLEVLGQIAPRGVAHLDRKRKHGFTLRRKPGHQAGCQRLNILHGLAGKYFGATPNSNVNG